MSQTVAIKPIAHIKNDFTDKFGIPRQSGLIEEIKSRVVFEPEFRKSEALRGIEAFSHLWLIWHFSQSGASSALTVRPPRLGGNRRMGVFATRSPFRPNPIGLSCVKLDRVEWDTPQGPILHLSGADLMDGTPIFDIKPYLPQNDAFPDAVGGFTEELSERHLSVCVSDDLLSKLPGDSREALIRVLERDPRPAYHVDPARVYGFEFARMNVRFRVEENEVTVISIEPRE